MADAPSVPLRLRLLLVLLFLAHAVTALEVPYLAGRVNDYANLLSDATSQRLEAGLADFERETGAQVAVLTIESLEGEPLEDYSLRVAETWQLGREGVDDGVLLLISEQDRKLRIEVGYGLEASLTDVQSRRILDELVVPRFRQGDFDGGAEAGVEAILTALRGGDPLPAAASRPAGDLEGMPWPARLFMGGMFFFIVGMFSLHALFSSGCQSWFLWLFLMPFWLLFPMAIFHPVVGPVLLGAWIVLVPLFKLWFRRIGGEKAFKRRYPAFGGWVSGFGGAGSRGGGFSGGFGGGGFSGGGGSFGGGGASSGW